MKRSSRSRVSSSGVCIDGLLSISPQGIDPRVRLRPNSAAEYGTLINPGSRAPRVVDADRVFPRGARQLAAPVGISASELILDALRGLTVKGAFHPNRVG